jgi:nucleoside-diphosphate-sugar epimerase
MNILILGANGFIGSHLCEKILSETDWHITALDLKKDNLDRCLGHARFHFTEGDMRSNDAWIQEKIQQTDVVFPLVAIANPAIYVQDPLSVFELDFEANLIIIRYCVQYQKTLIFPSTSEVYGMCPDQTFDEENSPLVTGPIAKERWIYSTSKQLLDRVIHAYGKKNGLNYILFRPFNWFGPRLDNIWNPKPGGSRVMTQFIGNILRGEDISLVEGGSQKRCFLFINDGINALMRIIRYATHAPTQRIFNIGNPGENYTIRDLATILIEQISHFPQYADQAKATKLVDVTAQKYYGNGYQDIQLRVPSIQRAEQFLEWHPQYTLQKGINETLHSYLA